MIDASQNEDENNADLSQSAPAPVPPVGIGQGAVLDYGGPVDDSRVGDNDFIQIETSNSMAGAFKFRGPAKTAPLVIGFLGIIVGGFFWAAFSWVLGLLVMTSVLGLVATYWSRP